MVKLADLYKISDLGKAYEILRNLVNELHSTNIALNTSNDLIAKLEEEPVA